MNRRTYFPFVTRPQMIVSENKIWKYRYYKHRKRERENVGKYLLPPPLQNPRVIINRLKIPRDGTGNASFVVIDLDYKTIEFYDLEYQMKNFYNLTMDKYAPRVQDSSFWANKFGYFSKST